MDIETGVKSTFYMNEFETDYKENLESKITFNKLLLPSFYLVEQYISMLSGSYLTEHHISEDTTNILEYYMMCSSSLANPASATINKEFLTSTVN